MHLQYFKERRDCKEEFYDPHANCMKFLGPRSQHGDGGPRPDYNVKDGTKGRGTKNRSALKANRDTTSSAYQYGHTKKKSIMQCKMEQDLELKRQEEEAVMEYKFTANPIPRSTYELRYTRYIIVLSH